jgi:hypothetical protein
MISENSPLRRLPDNLNLRQRLILDAIRYGAEMTSSAYYQLQNTLLTFSNWESGDLPENGFVSAFSEAWSIVDCIDRLQPSIKLLPGRETIRDIDEFFKSAQYVRLLRNSVQHLHARFDRLVSAKQGTWGSISWVSFSGSNKPIPIINMIGTGSMQGGLEYKMVNPAVKELSSPIGLITLNAHGYSIEIDILLQALSKAISAIEAALAGQFSGLTTSVADVYVRIPITEVSEASSE